MADSCRGDLACPWPLGLSRRWTFEYRRLALVEVAPQFTAEMLCPFRWRADEVCRVSGGMVDVNLAANPIGPMNPGSEPSRCHAIGSPSARGLATPGNFCDLTAFSS